MSLKKKKEMASLLRKLSSRRSSGRSRGGEDSSCPGQTKLRRRDSEPSVPVCPPSPTLAHLTQDEIKHLNNVFSRLEEFEQEEKQRVRRLQQEVQCYEDMVRQQTAAKSRLKQMDLRLCRLCFKTKFADGIGKLCHECHRRVCNRCGTFSRESVEFKMNKVRWRCNLCRMRRELACASGVWYHGGQAEPLLNPKTFRRKLGDAGIQSDYDIQADVEQSDSTSNPTGHSPRSDPEVARLTGLQRDEALHGRRQSRRRLTSPSDDQNDEPNDDEDLEEDDEHFLQEREKCRQERLQLQYKKSKKRHKRSSVGTSTQEDGLLLALPRSQKRTTSTVHAICPRHGSAEQDLACRRNREDSPRDKYQHEDVHPRRASDEGAYKTHSTHHQQHSHNIQNTPRKGSNARPISTAKSDSRIHTSHKPPRLSGKLHELKPPQPSQCNSPPPRVRAMSGPHSSTRSRELRCTSGSQIQKEKRKGSCPNCRSSRPNSVVRRSASSASQLNKREGNQHCQSQLDFPTRMCNCTSDPGLMDMSNTNLLNPHLSTFKKEVLSSSSLPIGEVTPARHPSLEGHNIHVPCFTDSASLQVPGITCSSDNERSSSMPGLGCGSSGSAPRLCLGTSSEGVASGGAGRTSTNAHGQGDRENGSSPRKASSTSTIKSADDVSSLGGTLSVSDCDVMTRPTRAPFRRSSSCSHFRVVLSRDPKDSSCRTGGLGMRVVGGKVGPDGGLSAFITFVQSGGPADLAGISEGDQILEWDGSSLKDATFEEAQQILNKAGDTVQLVVLKTRRGLESGADESHKKTPQWHRGFQGSTAGSSICLDSREGSKVELDCLEDPSKLHSRQIAQRRFSDEEAYKMKSRIALLERVATLDVPESSCNDRPISGRVQMNLKYNPRAHVLVVTVIRATNLSGRPSPSSNKTGSVGEKTTVLSRKGSGDNLTPEEMPRVFCKLRLVPKGRHLRVYRTEVSPASCEPEWNQSYTIEEIKAEELARLSLLVTVWDYYPQKLDIFLGEVLLDLLSANLQDNSVWYPLEDHDENMGPVPQPSPKATLHLFSPALMDGEDTGDGRQAWKSLPMLPETPAHDRIKELLNCKKPGSQEHRRSAPTLTNYKVKMPPSSESGSTTPPMNNTHDEVASTSGKKVKGRISFLKRRMSEVALKVGAVLADKREVNGNGSRPSRSTSYERRFSLAADPILQPLEVSQGPVMSSLMAGDPGMSGASSLSSASGIPSSSTQAEMEDDEGCPPSTRESILVGEDLAAMLGPGQVSPKSTADDLFVKGDLKLAFVVTKGQLELEVICAKGLTVKGNGPPDSYVKTYLVDGGRKIQKKKTRTVRASQDPLYVQKLKYSACNVHGRHIQVQIKEKISGFERNSSLGEVVVRLDDMELSSKTTGWYKLFKPGAVQLGSTDSLHF